MPTQSTRIQRAAPAKASRLFCMHCPRTVNTHFDPGEGVAFDIGCYHDARASVLCRLCSDKNKTCTPACTGMLGNAFDLAAILKWQQDIIESDIWNGDVKRTILKETHDLAIAFDCAESAHAREHGLKGTRKAVRSNHHLGVPFEVHGYMASGLFGHSIGF
ncbi:hypothetical protein BO70DRAFT_410047 [Aspergillus heteromorphus CBS 117.55]|uniref:Uncharacterized protein n=1 Tax=Aspergillus heteromorphus CBS 117.55 TaxID=1448321 RepID=A0A317X188_9EURO|nr:uncharacterized protein BO70DRAFT_410047 [Aspergillus heteromorphus CBS 117.55]PWY90708.1 hypothetical protein BO70DRAFT_410047 [Aspergillus heteromorphus CBS 117.55]